MHSRLEFVSLGEEQTPSHIGLRAGACFHAGTWRPTESLASRRCDNLKGQRSWRSTLIICISIPLSVLKSLLLLSVLGESINVMTLGGLALAVGALVDDATVESKTSHRNLGMGEGSAGRQSSMPPRRSPSLHSSPPFCVRIVFVPMFFLSGVSRYLFVPLAEAAKASTLQTQPDPP